MKMACVGSQIAFPTVYYQKYFIYHGMGKLVNSSTFVEFLLKFCEISNTEILQNFDGNLTVADESILYKLLSQQGVKSFY